MRNEFEKTFGELLHQIAGNLIKNAEPVPENVLKGALAFEKHKWHSMPLQEQIDLVRNIERETEAPSAIYRHYESYPHPFSRTLFSKFSAALKDYKQSLMA